MDFVQRRVLKLLSALVIVGVKRLALGLPDSLPFKPMINEGALSAIRKVSIAPRLSQPYVRYTRGKCQNNRS
jgi:hypothetical protein